MKKTIYIIGIATLVLSCKEKTPVDYALISGKLLNNTANQIILTSAKDRTFKDTIQVSNDGSFSDTIRAGKGLYLFTIDESQTNLYLENGYNLIINADSKALDSTIVLSGKGAAENNFLKSRAKKAKELEGSENIYTLEEEEFKNKRNSIVSSLSEMLENTKDISESFRLAQQKDINYTYLNMLANFESYHSYYAKKEDFKVGSDFLKDLDNIDYGNEEDYENSKAYQSLVSYHYRYNATKMNETEGIPRDIAMLKTISTIKSETIKNDLLNATIYGMTITEHLDDYYTLFMATSTDDKQKKSVEEYYENLKKIQIGEPSPKFENYENYAGGTTSLDDLKGKYVYIDVWATWCGPCLAQIPALKETEKSYHNKNIQFLSISLDKPNDYEKWRTMIKDKELGGVQLLADKDFESRFIKDYVIRGIPKFILLDPEGNIVKANAPRPSDIALIELFDKLGIK